MTMNHHDNELNNERQYDNLEQILAARPLVRAPRNTMSRVMARIAALPQQNSVANFAPPAVTPIRYAPPPVLPLPEAEDEVAQLRGRLTRLIFTSAWISLSALFIYLIIWPAISNLFLGGQNDFNLVLRTVQLWNGLVNMVSSVFATIAPLLPSMLSALVGLVIMLLIFTMQRRRFRLG